MKSLNTRGVEFSSWIFRMLFLISSNRRAWTFWDLWRSKFSCTSYTATIHISQGVSSAFDKGFFWTRLPLERRYSGVSPAWVGGWRIPCPCRTCSWSTRIGRSTCRASCKFCLENLSPARFRAWAHTSFRISSDRESPRWGREPINRSRKVDASLHVQRWDVGKPRYKTSVHCSPSPILEQGNNSKENDNRQYLWF